MIRVGSTLHRARLKTNFLHDFNLLMKKRVFPKNFLWGAAISAYQVEGGNVFSDWYAWEQSGKTIDKCGEAVQHARYFAHDIDLAADLGMNAFRISIEWSRIEPSPQRLNTKELERYRQVLLRMKQRGLQTFVTLHHFTLPQWFVLRGGFEKRSNIVYFLNFVRLIADEFKELIDFWIVLNEPMIYAAHGYFEGSFPPGKQSRSLYMQVLHNLVYTHKHAYRLINAHVEHAQVGIAKNNQFFEPASNRFLDRWVVKKTQQHWNHFFLRKVEKELDFIGLNYYFHNRLSFRLYAGWQPNHIYSVIRNENLEQGDNGFEIYPKGLYHVLMELKEYHKPVYITENGIADRSDLKRQKFLYDHLKEVYIALKDFCDVRGYLYWSLLDNYEWGSFGPRFGLASVNYKTFERRLRPSAIYYKGIIKENAIVF